MKKIYWIITELIKMYSDTPSFFSKKRVESGIAFFAAESGMVYYFWSHLKTMDMASLVMWASTQFLVAGYSISKIQEEKKENVQP